MTSAESLRKMDIDNSYEQTQTKKLNSSYHCVRVFWYFAGIRVCRGNDRDVQACRTMRASQGLRRNFADSAFCSQRQLLGERDEWRVPVSGYELQNLEFTQRHLK